MQNDSGDSGSHEERSGKSPRQRFLTVAARRVETILKTLRLLGNCANPQSYQYQEHEVERMFDAIERELQLARAKFDQRRKKRVQFRFDE